ncbi:serine/threonine protein kinase [Streptomyces sp. CS7]|uniref:serine/threonine-protein kinase n=1 Tax=Streptomyces sp. CS-7 TaxID=2906769 RepID=UPI0021B47352|nr:serine/threonine-protein kinase [Streptomyces sp. CS-7]MCT6775094.1 serine/threonine protein kinase [Streptomyces sp. CS-7]
MSEGAGKGSRGYTAMEGIRPLVAGDPVRIGPYPLLGRLGAGGMGRVYLARSVGGRTVAVKVVHEEHIANGEFRARFRREIEAARRVGGRYTAPVLDADADAERPWVATGYVPGPSLEQAVREHGPLPAASVNALADGLLRALRGIHAAGIVHRDLKPSNVLLTVDGPRVIDFGIARALQVSVESLLTSTGMVIGSPGFMAPEQILGEETGAGADVFSLGCVLMYAATGRLPFGAGASNQHAVMFRIVQSPPDLDAVEDAFLRELIERCLTKSASERPGVDELLEGLAPDPSSDALRGAWLPPVLLARLAQQSALLLDADVPERADIADALDVSEALDVPESVEVGDGLEPASPVAPGPRDLGTVDLRPAPEKGDEAGSPSPGPDPGPSPASAPVPALSPDPEPARPAASAVPDVPGAGDRPGSARRRRAWGVAAVVVAVLAAGGTTAFLNRDPGGADSRGGDAAAPPAAPPAASDGPSGDPAAPAGKDDGKDGSKGSGKDKDEDKDKGEGDGKGKEGADEEQGGGDGGDSGGGAGSGEGGGEGAGASGGSGTQGGSGSSGAGGSGGAAKPPAPDPAPDGRVPQHFVGTWAIASQYDVLQPHTVVIRRVSPGQSAVTLIADVQGSGHCEYTAKLGSVADGGKRINVGTAVVDKARSGAMCRDTDPSFFTVAGSGILHDVGPAHGSGYRYNRA